jgi:hypothetical protein
MTIQRFFRGLSTIWGILALVLFLGFAGCEDLADSLTANDTDIEDTEDVTEENGEDDPDPDPEPDPEPEPVPIATAEDFAKIGKEANYPLGGVYALTEDITLADWTPLGTEAAPFTGTIRGNDKTITLDGFNTDALKGKYIGVLGYASGAKLQDITLSLGLSNPTTIGTSTPADKTVGGLVAHALRSEFTAIHAAGALNIKENAGAPVTTGGIAGVLERSTVRDSDSTVAVTVNVYIMNSSSGIIAGGITGSADLSAIFSSSYTGTLHCTASNIRAGGIAGVLQDHRSPQPKYSGNFGIYDCSTSGTVTTGQGATLYIGGITGIASGGSYNPGIITRCASTMTITGDPSPVWTMSTPSGYAGGITAVLGKYGVIRDSYSRGNVTLTSGSQTHYAGGIAGNVLDTVEISNCYTTGTVSAHAQNVYSYSNPISAYAGGITGRIQTYNGGTPLIQNCAALNAGISLQKYSVDGVRPRRIGDTGKGGTLSGNIANADMTISIVKHNADTPDPPAMDKTADGMDGADCDATPAQSVFEGMGWDFVDVWEMGPDGYPRFISDKG